MATQAVDRSSPACLTCGAVGPPGARFCSVCGVPFGSVPTAAPEPDRCEIARWRGYTRSTFYATTPDGTMFESKPFAWRHAAPPPPDHEGARSCYEALVERLLAGGWERESQGVIWYETGFVRGAPGMAPATVASEEPAAQPAPEPEPEPEEKKRRATPRWARSLLAVKRVLAMAALVCVILAATFVVVGAAHPSAKHAATPPPPAFAPAAPHRAGGVARAAPARGRSSPTCASRPGETAPGSRYGAAPARERCSTRVCWFRGHSCTSARHVYGPGWVRPATFRSPPTAVRSRSEAPTTRCSCPRLRSRKARARANRRPCLPGHRYRG